MSDRADDERLERAVDEARRQAEERATAEILALERDLEREREHAARALEEVQRRLDQAEARAASGSSATGPQDREKQLIAEREGARRSERERELLEQSRAELEARLRREPVEERDETEQV
jgi:hypothetical protein